MIGVYSREEWLMAMYLKKFTVQCKEAMYLF